MFAGTSVLSEQIMTAGQKNNFNSKSLLESFRENAPCASRFYVSQLVILPRIRK